MRQASKHRNRRDILEVSQRGDHPGVPYMRTVEDPGDIDAAPVRTYRARLQVFVPAIAVAVIYSGAWIYFYAEGQQNSSLARLTLIVLAIGVPIMAAHAFLRFQTIRIQVMSRGLRYHPGWPKDLPVDLPYELVDRVRVKRSLVSWLLSAGTVVIELTTGERVAIADIYRPDKVKSSIETAMGRTPAE